MKNAGRKRLSVLLSAAICCSGFSAYGRTALAAGELADTERNLKIVKLTSSGNLANGIFYYPDKDAVISSNDANYEQNALIFQNVKAVYDFFDKTLGYRSWSYTDEETGITDDTFYAGLLGTSGEAKCEKNFILLGESDENYCCMASAKDVIGHEMMHLVTLKKCHWTTTMESAETKALMEAYSDIIGELADDAADWKIGTAFYQDQNAGYSMRDIANPGASKYPNFVTDYTEQNEPVKSVQITANDLYTDYNVYMKEINNIKSDQAIRGEKFNPSIRGSLVVSHAAYLMNKAGIPRKDLAQIWFNSLDFYKAYMPQATFIDCRRAVTNAAVHFVENQNYSADQRAKYLDAINYGFDSAKIYAEHFGYSLQYGETETTQKDAHDASYLTSFLTAEQKKYPDGHYWMADDLDTSVPDPVEFKLYTECSGISVTALVTDGLGIYDSISEEPYYQCAGFARKLQQDFFGTNKYIRISDVKNFVPKPGDHLRGRHFSKIDDTGSSHSVFVTAVSGDTITLADCNANGDMQIQWNRKRATGRDENGVFYWSEGTEQFKLEWVERPVPLGDLSGDAAVTSADVEAMQNLLYGIEPENTDFAMLYHAADLNCDCKIDSSDLSLLLRFANSSEPTGLYGYIK